MRNYLNRSIKNQILLFAKARYPDWVGGIEIEKLALSKNYKSSNASRRARELYQEGFLERREGAYVEYRYIPPRPMTQEERISYQDQLLRIGMS